MDNKIPEKKKHKKDFCDLLQNISSKKEEERKKGRKGGWTDR